MNLVSNGDFSDGLSHWSTWISRDGQLDFAAAVGGGELTVSGSDINGGVYQQFDVTPGWVVTVTGRWRSGPTLPDAMWAEVLVINAHRVPVDGVDETDGNNSAVLLYKNDTFSGRGAWDDAIPKSAPVKYQASFTAATSKATLILKTGNTGPATLTATTFDDIEVHAVPPAATMAGLPSGFAGRTYTFPVSNMVSIAQSPVSRNIYAISNQANAADTRLYLINVAGGSITTSTVSGLGSLVDYAQGLTFDPVGNIYISTQYGHIIKGVDANPDPAVDSFSFSTIVVMPPLEIGTFHGVGGVAVGPDSLLYINSGSESHYGYLSNGSLEVFEGRLNARILRCELDGSNLGEFCAGIRNTFDITFRADGKLFGVENGPNTSCDYAEEFNLLELGNHYGFPYKYGDDFSGSDSSYVCTSVGTAGPPPLPGGLVPTPAWANYGPDAKPGPGQTGYGDGGVYYGFNPHSSPDGVDFYEPQFMGPAAIRFPAEFDGRAFVARLGNIENVPTVGFDVLSLRLDDANEGFTCNRFLVGLGRAIDVLCAYNGRVYVLEYNQQTSATGPGWGTPSKLYEIAYTIATQPIIGLSTNAITRSADYTYNISDDAFTVSNAGSGTLAFTVDDDESWLSVDPSSGTSIGPADMKTITVSYAVAGLPIGPHTATITVSDPAALNDPRMIAVTVTVRTVRPDIDQDGDVDVTDFAHVQACYNDVLNAPPVPACADADLDGNNTVDFRDVVPFLNCLSGAGILADRTCDDAYAP
ncbi:MAG: PQQ-dependent sugar dehydrogenase [Planctomycetes bacterium]|nr:PQQ-dependent sugar dehydrogenase [Planctomycetota bacterium]